MKNNKQTLKQTFAGAFENYKKKDLKNAAHTCYKILSIDPNHFDAISLLATICGIEKNFSKAKELMLQAIEIKPNNLSALNNLGTAYKELGNLKEAINAYTKVLEIDPNHINANYNLGLSFYGLRELKKAKSYLQKTIGIQNNYAMAFFVLGNVHADLKEHKDAISCYQKTIKINPNIVGAYNNLGLVFREQNDLQNAISSYQKGIKIKPNYVPTLHNLGQAFKETGEFEKSIQLHQTAIEYEPENLTNDYFLCELKKDALNPQLKIKIEKILTNSNATINNLAYGNYLLAKYERKTKNYENELNFLKKGHYNFYKKNKKKFDLGIKYCFDDVLQILEKSEIEKSNKESDIKIKPIFIFGVPRTGSTLVERIIVSGEKNIPLGEETGIIGRYVPNKVLKRQSLNFGNVDIIRGELFEIYKEKGLISKKYDHTFTDKSLDNFFYLKLIKQIYPDAKLILCKRDALSSIMSIFQNNLTELAWTHDLENIFKYFDNYFKIIENFKKKNPTILYELQFEKLIKEPEEESKKLMKFCELPWGKKCLEFYKRKDLFSKTASNIQVREAIYKHSENKYLPYKKILDKYGKKYSWFN